MDSFLNVYTFLPNSARYQNIFLKIQVFFLEPCFTSQAILDLSVVICIELWFFYALTKPIADVYNNVSNGLVVHEVNQ